MTKVSKLMRKLFRKDNVGLQDNRSLNLRLRKAVTFGKARQVAALLDEGASPVWMEDEAHSRRRRGSYPCQLNALLLACRFGDDQVLSMLLDAFFQEPQVLAHFSRAMYCLVIRHDHWKAFQRLQQRRVPMISLSSRSSTDSTSSPTSVASTQLLSQAAMDHASSKLPVPIFMAAEHGRHHILKYLLDHYPHEWAHYTFEGHSLLSVATINGHYECVRVLLDRQVATGRSLDAAVALARRHRQAHILVLLTTYLPEFTSDPEPEPVVYKNNLNSVWPNQLTRIRGRGSIAETVASDSDEESRRSSLVAMSSPINYKNPNEDMDRVEEMRVRAEMQREQRQTGMMWFLDGREPVEDMQRRVDPYGLDGFAVLTSARDTAPNSYSQEEASWYAVKSSEKNRQHENLLESDEEENSYESLFSVHDQVNSSSEPPVSGSSTQAPRSSPILRPGRSHKLISVRSRGFQQHRLLAAIEEHPAGETEA
ncbi:hypothetical protein DVH05_023528 [Phytophthora capsici]|nr:hypothetical protein DVH05_023528 [Phytophthora capsici]|eukprot:jgi/Phyca11/525047/estExt2_fgenesh1_pm.C_PHYCAscaffold_10282